MMGSEAAKKFILYNYLLYYMKRHRMSVIICPDSPETLLVYHYLPTREPLKCGWWVTLIWKMGQEYQWKFDSDFSGELKNRATGCEKIMSFEQRHHNVWEYTGKFDLRVQNGQVTKVGRQDFCITSCHLFLVCHELLFWFQIFIYKRKFHRPELIFIFAIFIL